MANIIRIGGVDFNRNFLNSYMKNIFGESFAHSSLSFEKVFEEGKKCSQQLVEFISPENTSYARSLKAGSSADFELLKQRYSEIVFALTRYGVPKERIHISETETSPCIADFTKYFDGAVRPYRNTVEINNARANGLLKGYPYEEETLLSRIQLLFNLISEKIKADTTAYQLKKGNNDAFAYSLSLPALTVKDIIDINSKVNNESGIHKGFKTSNNDIPNAPFETCPKELVPIRMQELMHKYNNEWAKEIPPYIEGIHSNEQKQEHLKAICEREAKFHIEFERIHPFEDGNGRTGRIILNSNLIKNELAPILITPEMRKIYLRCIAEEDYKTLGEHILMLSSVTLTEMVSQYRRVRKISPDELGLTPDQLLSIDRDLMEMILNQNTRLPIFDAEDADIKIYNKKH